MVDDATRVLRIVYALNRVWPPTTKRVAARVEGLPVKPERLAERIEEALTEPDPFRALLVLNELQLETVELAPSGPNVDRARRLARTGAGSAPDRIAGVTEEARLEQTDSGLKPATEGWFVVNVGETGWAVHDAFGSGCTFEGRDAPVQAARDQHQRRRARPAALPLPRGERAGGLPRARRASACCS